MPRIQDQVAENRRDVRQINGRFVIVPDRQDENLSFSRNTLAMSLSVEVYTRPLNDSLVSGHPDGSKHGSGQGVAGDVRGGWTLQEDAEASTSWTRDGRNAVRDSLAGDTGSITAIGVGTSGATASPNDAALGTETGRTSAYGLRAGEAFNAVRHRANFRSTETGESGLDPVEYGVFDDTGRLMGRVTTSAVSVGPSEEVRVDLTTTITGSGVGQSVLTDDGEAAVADSLQLGGVTVGLNKIAWGTGASIPTESDTSLDNEVFRRVCAREKGLESIQVSAPQFETEPNGQPYDYTEVGVLDNQGQLVWRTTLTAFEKDNETQFSTSVGFKLV